MIQQLVQRLMNNLVIPADQAAAMVLTADPLDLMLHMEQVWNDFDPWAPNPPPAGPARQALISLGQFNAHGPAAGAPAWDHIGYSYVLENSRAVQIFKRVVRKFRAGEDLGIPSVATQRWLDATEALLFGAANPFSSWLSTSQVRPDADIVRRLTYKAMIGLPLAFGTEDNRPVDDQATTVNSGFVPLFEELLFELWKSMTNVRNVAGENASDDDRIYSLVEELQYQLRSHRQNQMLAREELAAATVLGWVELTLSANTPVVVDLRAQATSPSDRLRMIGERVGLAPHSKCSAFFSMASELSLFLRTVEAGLVTGSPLAWLLYLEQPPTGAPPTPLPIGAATRTLINQWGVAARKDLKARSKPVDMGRRQLVAVR